MPAAGKRCRIAIAILPNGCHAVNAFQRYSPFLRLSRPRSLRKVIHKAFINVAEKGTEAAAATAVIGNTASLPPAPQLFLTADRPFLYFLRDQRTGAILFMGRVMDPSQN